MKISPVFQNRFLIAIILFQHTLAEWRLVFWITLAVLVGTNIVFVLFASGDEQWWNDPQKVKNARNNVEEGKTREQSNKNNY